MSRRLLSVTLVACSTILLAACGSSGTHTQSYSPSPTAPASSSTNGSAPSPTATNSSPRASKSSSLPAPTVTPPAQDAVDAYVAMLNSYNTATRDPAHADLAGIDKYLSGKALTITANSLAAMKKASQAYRGTPADPRVKVGSTVTPAFVILISCPLTSATDPFTEYDVATGKAVPAAQRTPPPPYLLTLPMQKAGSQWKLTDILQNTSKTCSA
jgi:hypothetical protein